jgi:hypothetical protein
MTDMEILQLADKCGIIAVTKHEWDGKKFNHADDYLDGDGAALIIFAKQVAQRTWVGLTDDERKEVWWSCEQHTPTTFAQAIEAKLKEKNT